jgi:hypothetical protein
MESAEILKEKKKMNATEIEELIQQKYKYIHDLQTT